MMFRRERKPSYGQWRGCALYETVRELSMAQRPLRRDELLAETTVRVIFLAKYDAERASEGVLASMLLLAKKEYAEVAWVNDGKWEKGWQLTDSGWDFWRSIREPGDGSLYIGHGATE